MFALNAHIRSKNGTYSYRVIRKSRRSSSASWARRGGSCLRREYRRNAWRTSASKTVGTCRLSSGRANRSPTRPALGWICRSRSTPAEASRTINYLDVFGSIQRRIHRPRLVAVFSSVRVPRRALAFQRPAQFPTVSSRKATFRGERPVPSRFGVGRRGRCGSGSSCSCALHYRMLRTCSTGAVNHDLPLPPCCPAGPPPSSSRALRASLLTGRRHP
jgi:hypothetical protein